MDIQAFQERLPALYGGDLYAEHPVDRRFRELMDDVPGMASENKLALLNLAGSLVEPGETYLEVGSFKGLSIIAAMLGNSDPRFVAVESFREFGVDREETRTELVANLERWRVRDRLTVLEEDCFRLFGRPGLLEGPVGVYFYDGNHGSMAQYLALGMVEPILADRALVIVDDASWPVVARATERYVRAHPGFRLLYDLESERDFDPKWWCGVKVYAYDRSAAASRSGRADIEWRRLLYVNLYEPATYLAGKALYRRPGLMKAVKKVVPLSSRRVKGPTP
ncbi:MAG: class I SAM-dependent methyltransferase [Actinomycetota bacterium]|nr:class I SAM-dependent methyltransferase [Actinomycetota bacterium]